MKMTRAEKRRRKIAKIVEMKLDGVPDMHLCKGMSFEELHQHHAHWKKRDTHSYWGPSLVSAALMQKAQQMQSNIDKAILEGLNGKSISTN